MSEVSDAIRGHHRELLETFARYVEALAEEGPETGARGLSRFLQEELLPHAEGEERHLYPAMEPWIQKTGRATATMSVDHEWIEGYVRKIGEAAEAMERAGPEERTALRRTLRDLALQLDAVLRLHLEKEERVYLPLFEENLSPAEQQRVLNGMHAAYGEEAVGGGQRELDVRRIPPRERHPLIFEAFDGLPPGGAFVLVNDHDPKPLYYQFLHERPDRFSWEYLEEGPEVWRVRIGKTR